MMVALTIIVYIQDNVSWSWGLGIPTSMMFLSVTSFLLGAKLYIRVTPEGMSLTNFLQVLVGAGRNTIYRFLHIHPTTMTLHIIQG